MWNPCVQNENAIWKECDISGVLTHAIQGCCGRFTIKRCPSQRSKQLNELLEFCRNTLGQVYHLWITEFQFGWLGSWLILRSDSIPLDRSRGLVEQARFRPSISGLTLDVYRRTCRACRWCGDGQHISIRVMRSSRVTRGGDLLFDIIRMRQNNPVNTVQIRMVYSYRNQRGESMIHKQIACCRVRK